MKITKNIHVCKTTWEQGTGLMFTKKMDEFAYIFPRPTKKNEGITMMFVFFSIDVVFLREGRIVDIVEDLRPWSSYWCKEITDCFIEFPSKTVKKNALQIGQKVVWTEKKVQI